MDFLDIYIGFSDIHNNVFNEFCVLLHRPAWRLELRQSCAYIRQSVFSPYIYSAGYYKGHQPAGFGNPVAIYSGLAYTYMAEVYGNLSLGNITMKSKIKYAVKVFAAGFIVIVLLSVPLFWLRLICQEILGKNLPSEAKNIYMQPSGLVPPEIENDPNVVRHSSVSAYMDTGELPLYGIVNCFKAEEPAVYYYFGEEHWAYFDKKLGLFVCAYTPFINVDGKTKLAKTVTLYVGPEGISETAAQNLGRFIIPIVDTENINPDSPVLTGYDKELRCFFVVNLEKRVVTKGPQLSKDDFHKPIQIGRLSGISESGLTCLPPEVNDTDEKGDSDGKHIRDKLKPIINYTYHSAGQYELVLDESGQIDLLDKKTLTFAGKAGFLPALQTLFGSKDAVTPKDLLDYSVFPLTFKDDNKYRGCFVRTVSREGTSMALAVFDEKGKMIKCDYTKVRISNSVETMQSSDAFFFGSPAAPVVTIIRYLLENLQPPILSMASFVTADSFSAVAGHNALFILPNSFVAMTARRIDQTITAKLFLAVFIIFPSLVLSIWLTCKVARDAAMVGLSDRVKFYWKLGTTLFGLSAYITYRLTRPDITLVTCENCGKLRRPDMENCHRCGGKWHIQELTPPAWRVVD